MSGTPSGSSGRDDRFWQVPEPELLRRLDASAAGLSGAEARARLTRYGANTLRRRQSTGAAALAWNQFKSPLVLILLAAAVLSFFLRDRTNAAIILAIVLVSAGLGFLQERGAAGAIEKLLAVVRVKARVRRDGREAELPVEEVVPGDIVLLEAGDVVPADCRLLASRDLFGDEATLTGESFPVEKQPGEVAAGAAASARTNALFMGTHVVSGTGTALVVKTGRSTVFGGVSDRLRLRPPETEFERGVRRFGYLLMEVTLVLVVAIFASNVFLARPVFDSFLFALALAVGLTPQLLPAIISVSLARGAQLMAREKVIVKRLAAIENFGSMNVLCSDKTGTLTRGEVRVRACLDAEGNESGEVRQLAWLNATFQTGFTNPVDEAVRRLEGASAAGFTRLDEVPYDFVRKRLSILVRRGDRALLASKGALAQVLEVCDKVRTRAGDAAMSDLRPAIDKRFAELSGQGLRVLGVASRDMGTAQAIARDCETGMTFIGFLVLEDPPKDAVADRIADLRATGVRLKVVTGDNRLVAARVACEVGLLNPEVISGPELHDVSDEALPVLVDDVDVFAEVEPNQKERIVNALKKAGNVVGFLGDGINDAPALRAADVGISVDGAVDVAKGAADIVLLEKDLGVLNRGIAAGRRTFANTLKYVFMATSANFGNMFSMAGASLFLPFLPLLPTQILLTNLLTDLPEMTIADDHVDPEMVERPRRWDIRFIRRFMLSFGLLSSVFDYLTFGALLLLLHASKAQFRTGWFIESVVSAVLIVLVIRTRRPFFRSLPGRWLAIATAFVIAASLALPYTPLGRVFGFTPLPVKYLGLIAVVIVLYIAGAEFRKRSFYRAART